MKKLLRFRVILGLAVLTAAAGIITTYCLKSPSREITRVRFEQMLQNQSVTTGKVMPTPYAGIYHVEGMWASDGKPRPFSITTPLDADQLKTLCAQPAVTIEMPGTSLKDQWVNIVLTLTVVGFVGGLVLYQVNVGRGKHSRIRQRPTVRFSDVAGVEEAKAEVREVVDFLRDPRKYRRLGGNLPKGILLIGPPGTGKTMLAKAIAGEADANFFSAHGSDFNEVYVGVGAKRIRQLFREAARQKPAIIFIDEIDCLGKNRKFDSNGELQQTNNALLAAMDGFEGSEGVVVLAATNRPEDLDEALMRPGRFDRKVNVPYPDMKGRRAILEQHAKSRPIEDDAALDVIAQTTPGMSGADLANLLNEAAILCAQQNGDKICLPELEASRDKVCFGKERKSMVLTQREREMIACHEAGHALINLQMSLLPQLYKVSIIPRGNALGVTTLLPCEDQNIYSKDLLLQELTLLMGGRAAEKTFYGATTNGAGGDLNMARQLARKMVHEWGMGEKLYYEPEQHDAEREINRLLENADNEALRIIQAQKKNAEKLVQALLARETLTREEVLQLCEPPLPHGHGAFNSAGKTATA
ncbi:MAG: ATP-dependent metalloprotease FtsH [Pedosphaera sp.]|nr:ATP-dependent metalloprotease FtsH [Pedosphaera sp.]